MEARRTQTKSKSDNKQQTQILVIAIVVVAIAIALMAILLASNSGPVANPGIYEGIPMSRQPDGGFVLGNPEAPITLIEFADFVCPHCQTYHATAKQFIEEYVATGQARFEYRMFPVVDPTYSVYTAQLAECADTLRPGGFWEAQDILFELGSRGAFNNQTSQTLANRMGLNHGELVGCAGNAEQVFTDQQFGTQMGIQSTPSVMIRIGDSEPQFISLGNETFSRGPVPYGVIQAVMETITQ